MFILWVGIFIQMYQSVVIKWKSFDYLFNFNSSSIIVTMVSIILKNHILNSDAIDYIMYLKVSMSPCFNTIDAMIVRVIAL